MVTPDPEARHACSVKYLKSKAAAWYACYPFFFKKKNSAIHGAYRFVQTPVPSVHEVGPVLLVMF
jgi:hypothetical protein